MVFWLSSAILVKVTWRKDLIWNHTEQRNVVETLFNTLRPSDACMRQWTNHHWFRQWLVVWSVPKHYPNQCWSIVNRTLGNKLRWNLNQNSYIFIQQNAFENVVWKMVANLSWPQCDYFVVSTALADSLVSLGVSASAGVVTAKFGIFTPDY